MRGRGTQPTHRDCPDCGVHLSTKYLPTHRRLYCRGRDEEEGAEEEAGAGGEDEGAGGEEEEDGDEEEGDGLHVDQVLQDVQEVDQTVLGRRRSLGLLRPEDEEEDEGWHDLWQRVSALCRPRLRRRPSEESVDEAPSQRRRLHSPPLDSGLAAPYSPAPSPHHSPHHIPLGEQLERITLDEVSGVTDILQQLEREASWGGGEEVQEEEHEGVGGGEEDTDEVEEGGHDGVGGGEEDPGEGEEGGGEEEVVGVAQTPVTRRRPRLQSQATPAGGTIVNLETRSGTISRYSTSPLIPLIFLLFSFTFSL